MLPAYSNRPAIPLSAQSAGVLLKPEHAESTLGQTPCVDFFEIGAEDYMGDGGRPHRLLHRIMADHPITMQATCLSVGTDEPIDDDRLWRLRRLIHRYRPNLLSTPLAWSTHDGIFLNVALPLPHNREALNRVCDNVDRAQHELGMQILLENPASHVTFKESTMSETEFLHAIVEQTACGLVLDIGNVCVSAKNLSFEAMDYIDQFPIGHVREIHLAGFSEDIDDDGGALLIADPASCVPEGAWAIYRRVLGRVGPVPTLIERHNNMPALAVLTSEVTTAKEALLWAARQSIHRQPANSQLRVSQ